jgi:hypothetical protein
MEGVAVEGAPASASAPVNGATKGSLAAVANGSAARLVGVPM